MKLEADKKKLCIGTKGSDVIKNNHADCFDLMREEIQASSIRSHVQMNEFPKSFTRKRKMPINDMIFRPASKEKGDTQVRIVKAYTPSGEEIAFATNLYESEISGSEVKALYFKRWNSEEDYHTLKYKLKFESVTGEATIYVYQGFWAQILVYNMMKDVLHSANENMVISLLKKELIGLMLKSDKEVRNENMIKRQKAIEKYILPYRESKSQRRVFF